MIEDQSASPFISWFPVGPQVYFPINFWSLHVNLYKTWCEDKQSRQELARRFHKDSSPETYRSPYFVSNHYKPKENQYIFKAQEVT